MLEFTNLSSGVPNVFYGRVLQYEGEHIVFRFGEIFDKSKTITYDDAYAAFGDAIRTMLKTGRNVMFIIDDVVNDAHLTFCCYPFVVTPANDIGLIMSNMSRENTSIQYLTITPVNDGDETHFMIDLNYQSSNQ